MQRVLTLDDIFFVSRTVKGTRDMEMGDCVGWIYREIVRNDQGKRWNYKDSDFHSTYLIKKIYVIISEKEKINKQREGSCVKERW